MRARARAEEYRGRGCTFMTACFIPNDTAVQILQISQLQTTLPFDTPHETAQDIYVAGYLPFDFGTPLTRLNGSAIDNVTNGNFMK